MGSPETINAPQLQGYSLAADETARQTLMITSGNNEVVFKYARLAPEKEGRGLLWLALLAGLLCGVGVMGIIRAGRRGGPDR